MRAARRRAVEEVRALDTDLRVAVAQGVAEHRHRAEYLRRVIAEGVSAAWAAAGVPAVSPAAAIAADDAARGLATRLLYPPRPHSIFVETGSPDVHPSQRWTIWRRCTSLRWAVAEARRCHVPGSVVARVTVDHATLEELSARGRVYLASVGWVATDLDFVVEVRP